MSVELLTESLATSRRLGAVGSLDFLEEGTITINDLSVSPPRILFFSLRNRNREEGGRLLR